MGGARAQEPLQVAPPPTVAPYLPFPSLPAVPLDEVNNRVGIAQQLCRERGLQARLLWIDATANLERVNTPEKITALVAKIKQVGFNTIVFDVKPIVGETLYPSKFAPKLTEWVRPWATYRLPADFDPLKVMAATCKEQGIGLIVSLNALSEGHREFPGRGPAEAHPEWQTIVYENELILRSPNNNPFPLTDRANAIDDGKLGSFPEPAKLPKLAPGSLLAALDADGKVVALAESPAALTLPPGGAFLLGTPGAPAEFLRTQAVLGAPLTLETQPRFLRMARLPVRQVPLMVNPHQPAVRQRLLDMVSELAANYPLDGIIFDDRLRYAALNADFSDEARQAFEAWLGKSVRWPADVFRWQVGFPALTRYPVPGQHYEAWLTFRALTLRNLLADVRRTVQRIQPTTQVATYVGSWYPDYPELGANWAADDLNAGFHFLNESYRQCGWAGIADFVVTGCYYKMASLREALEKGRSIGDTVEAAGQFSNRAVHDRTFVYAGIQLEHFKGKPDDLKRALQAAAATTQGIMCFDLSHDIEPFWPIFAEAFAQPARAPHQVPGLLTELRRRQAQPHPEPPVILYRGSAGTGF